MKPLFASLLAALVATVALSILMVAKSMMGLMPQLNVIHMLATQMQGGPAMGWAAHFMIGVLAYGLVWALVFRRLPFGGNPLRGMLLGLAGWLVMMLVVMPMAGAGLFGLEMGLMAPVATLMLHIIFGLVLGMAYCALTGHKAEGAIAS